MSLRKDSASRAQLDPGGSQQGTLSATNVNICSVVFECLSLRSVLITW